MINDCVFVFFVVLCVFFCMFQKLKNKVKCFFIYLSVFVINTVLNIWQNDEPMI